MTVQTSCPRRPPRGFLRRPSRFLQTDCRVIVFREACPMLNFSGQRCPGIAKVGGANGDGGDDVERTGAAAGGSHGGQRGATRIEVQQTTAGARILDCGVRTDGGLQAGLGLARVCLAGLGDVTLVPGGVGELAAPLVQVATDAPVLACMAIAVCRLAGGGRQVSSPWARGRCEPPTARKRTIRPYPGREKPPVAVGVLETRKLPGDDVIAYLAEKLEMPPDKLTLLAAPASSLAGNLQVVARALETALHKLHELKFDLSQVMSGFGAAPLPPVAADELSAIGRTNDAILYGGRVVALGAGRRRPVARDRPESAVVGVARPRRAVRGDLQSLREGFLQDRSAAVQPGSDHFQQPAAPAAAMSSASSKPMS